MARFTKKRTRKTMKKTSKKRRTRTQTRCLRKRGGAQLPMIIDKNNVTYSCTPNLT